MYQALGPSASPRAWGYKQELSYVKILNLVPVVCYYPQGRGHVLCPKQPDLLMALLDEVPEGLVQVKAELLQAGPRAPQAVVGVMLG